MYKLMMIIALVSTFFTCSTDVADNPRANVSETLPISDPSASSDGTYEPLVPQFISECIDRSTWLPKKVGIPVRPKYNPYFLRGDFDGDGEADYAVTVEDYDTKQEGLLVCFRKKNSTAVLLGLDKQNPPPFWRLSDLDVLTPNEINNIYDFKGKWVNLKLKGESIVMKWEDGIGIIYWEGSSFQWKLVVLNSAK